MKHILFFILLTFSFLFPSCDDDIIEKKEEKPSSRYETIVGNTYVLRDLAPVEYIFYTFNEDGTIDIEVRENFLDGELLGKSVGYYEYNHPVIKLKVLSVNGLSECDYCFNNFEAKVADYRRDFTIKKFSGWNDTFFVYDSYYDTKYKLKPTFTSTPQRTR